MPLLQLKRVALVASALLAAGASFSQGAPAFTQLAATPAPTAVPVATPPPATPVPAVRPVRIEFPTLGVTAPVIPVGVDAEGAMGTPKTAHEVAWWDGVQPGAGNALLAGHKDWNRRQGSFYRISELKPGDPVRILGDAAALEFKVEWVQQMPGDAAAEQLLGDQGKPVLTLITCGGQFDRRVRHYKDRIVVRAVIA